MKKITKLELENFRGFATLTMDGFKRVNLFVGENNVGKSTVFDAFFLLLGMSSPQLISNVNAFRGLPLKEIALKSLFRNLDLSCHPYFQLFFDDQSSRSLELAPLKSDVISSSNVEIPLTTSNDTSLRGLEMFFKMNEEDALSSKVKIGENGQIEFSSPSDYNESLHGVYISSRAMDDSAKSCVENILKQKKKDLLVEILKQVDPEIDNIDVFSDGIYLSYVNVAELLPSAVAGDGIRKVLNIVATIAERNGSYVMIDEISNGLHYKSQKILWRNIFRLALAYDVQLFISTHSNDTLESLKEVLEETDMELAQDDFMLFSMKKTKKAGLRVYPYDFQSYKDSFDANIEVR